MRGQAALEFLTTYGWAFVVLTVMIGAVSYFGISNPETFVPERCQFPTDIVCKDFLATDISASASMIVLDLQQNTGRTIYLEDFFCDDTSLSSASLGYYHDPATGFENTQFSFPLSEAGYLDERQWDPAETISVKCLFEPAFSRESGDIISIPVAITVKKVKDGFDHMMEGELVVRIQ